MLVALPAAFGLGVSLSPDPTGFVPLAVGSVLTLVFATGLYRLLPDTTRDSSADRVGRR